MKKAGRLAAAVFAAMLLVTGCGAPAEKKAVETTPEQSSKIEQKEEAKNLKDAFKKDFKVGNTLSSISLPANPPYWISAGGWRNILKPAILSRGPAYPPSRPE